MKLFRRNTPRGIIFLIDLLIVAFGVVLAFMLRFDFSIPEDDNSRPLLLLIAVAMAVRGIFFLLFSISSGIVRYTSTRDVVRIFMSVILGSTAFVLIDVGTWIYDGYFLYPKSIIAIEFLVTLVGMIGYRVLVKITFMEIDNPRRKKSSVIIYGAGNNGVITKRTLDRDAGSKYRVLAMIDEDPQKTGKKIEGVPIHNPDKLPDLLANNEVAHVILSIPKIKPAKKQEIIDLCLSYNTKVLSVPPASKWINGELSFKQIKKVNIEDLLGREVIRLDKQKIDDELQNRTVLVTGAAGSIGSEIVRQLLKFRISHLILIDNAETPLHHLELELDELAAQIPFKSVLGDVRNRELMQQVFQRYKPEVVYHAAAYKHVPMLESNPREAVLTNILGSKNIADISLQHKVKRFIMVSTDKAVRPTSVMGASKRIAEIYTQSMNALNSTRFITTRFGNVLGSNGSVIPLFEKQIRRGGPLTITHPDVTRYFMTIPEACQLVLEASIMGQGGEIYIFDMGESVKIVDLARKMVKLSGLELGRDIQITYTGLRPGEKLYEELLSDKENTLPTHHPQIMVARVQEYDHREISESLGRLKKLAEQEDKNAIVKEMKAIVPEYRSHNSEYELLDKKQ